MRRSTTRSSFEGAGVAGHRTDVPSGDPGLPGLGLTARATPTVPAAPLDGESRGEGLVQRLWAWLTEQLTAEGAVAAPLAEMVLLSPLETLPAPCTSPAAEEGEQVTAYTYDARGRLTEMVADFAFLRVTAVRAKLPGPGVWLILRRAVTTGERHRSLLRRTVSATHRAVSLS